MKKLLEGLSDVELRELCMEALRRWHTKYPDRTKAAMHGDLGRELVPLLLERKPVALPEAGSLSPQEALIDAVTDHGMDGIAEFVNWFVRAGLAWPLGAPTNQYPIALHLTKFGIRLLEATKDHPLLPGFLDRTAARCPNLPDDVLSLLVDARSCLDQGLLRPAIQLMGVAYELAIEHVVEALMAKDAVSQHVASQKAALRIAAVKAVIEHVLPNATLDEREERYAVQAAYDFADQLRRRRNDASHTRARYGFGDAAEAEEFLVSAGRHLPNLWRMAR